MPIRVIENAEGDVINVYATERDDFLAHEMEAAEAAAEAIQVVPDDPLGVTTLHELVCTFIDTWEGAKGVEGRPPNEFMCPLSLHAMRDPVCAQDGNVYERAYIVAASKKSEAYGRFNSPLTRETIVRNWFPVKPLVKLMETWVRERVEGVKDIPYDVTVKEAIEGLRNACVGTAIE